MSVTGWLIGIVCVFGIYTHCICIYVCILYMCIYVHTYVRTYVGR